MTTRAWPSSNVLTLAVALVLLSTGPLRALAAETTPPRRRVAVLDLKPHGVEDSAAATLTGVFLAGLSEGGGIDLLGKSDLASMLSLDELRLLLGCSADDPSCVARHGQLLGDVLLVAGSVGKVGDRVVVSAAVIDPRAGTTKGRASRSASAESGQSQIDATRSLGAAIRDVLGLRSEANWTPMMAAVVRAGAYMSNYWGGDDDTDAMAFSLEGEADLFLLPELVAFAQVSVRRSANPDDSQRWYVPTVLGLKYRWVREWLTPYAGAGLSLGFRELDREDSAVSLHLLAGMEINPHRRFGGLVEVGGEFGRYFEEENFSQLGARLVVGGIYRF